MAKLRRGGTLALQSKEVLGWALGGLEKEITATRERLDSLTAQASALRARIGGRGSEVKPGANASNAPRQRRRRALSAEGRKRISEMMKKRWAEAKRKKQNRLS